MSQHPSSSSEISKTGTRESGRPPRDVNASFVSPAIATSTLPSRSSLASAALFNDQLSPHKAAREGSFTPFALDTVAVPGRRASKGEVCGVGVFEEPEPPQRRRSAVAPLGEATSPFVGGGLGDK